MSQSQPDSQSVGGWDAIPSDIKRQKLTDAAVVNAKITNEKLSRCKFITMNALPALKPCKDLGIIAFRCLGKRPIGSRFWSPHAGSTSCQDLSISDCWPGGYFGPNSPVQSGIICADWAHFQNCIQTHCSGKMCGSRG